MNAPFSLHALLAHLGSLATVCHGDCATMITGATADSREVRPGFLFVAIPGQKVDGARFVSQAVASGAVAIAAVAPMPLPAHIAQIQITEPYPAAARIAEFATGFPARKFQLWGVTGTKGKTTTAYLLRAMLQEAGRATGMIGTVEYDLGNGERKEADRTTPTPFELQKLFQRQGENGLTDVVIEVSSHALDQRRVGTALYAGAIFTNLSGDHMDYHPTTEHYFAAKKRLFSEGLATGAPALINLDDPAGARLACELRTERPDLTVIGFGQAAAADARLCELRTGIDGSSFVVALGGRRIKVESPLNGVFNISNLAGAALLGLAAGWPEDALLRALAACHGAPGRLEKIATPGRTVGVYVDYAHTDDSLKNVLQTLRGLRPSRLLLLIGCGGDRDRSKRPRMGQVAAELADWVCVTSDNPRNEEPAAIVADILGGIPAPLATPERLCVILERREAIRHAVTKLRDGDILLVAGKGHEPYQEINGVKYPYSDLAELRARLAEQLSPSLD